MKIVTWNVNSVRTRLPHLLAFLREYAPDVVLLQEIKCTDDAFPRMEIEDLSYNLAIYGEKSYNGVAILSKFPLEDVVRGLPNHPENPQCRYVEAVVSLPKAAVRVASIYVPNGQEVGSDKFAAKMAFFERLYAHAQRLLRLEEITVLGGDYNVGPEPVDVYDPLALDGSVCFHPAERAHLRAILHQGWYDAFRLLHPRERAFSFWDYRANCFAANLGLRIDHLLLSPQAADRLEECSIVHAVRAQEKASDHAPVLGQLRMG